MTEVTMNMRYNLSCLSWDAQHVKFTCSDRQGEECGTLAVKTEDVFRFLQGSWKGNVEWNGLLPDEASLHPEKYGAAPQSFYR
jgi:hypothetical protein